MKKQSTSNDINDILNDINTIENSIPTENAAKDVEVVDSEVVEESIPSVDTEMVPPPMNMGFPGMGMPPIEGEATVVESEPKFIRNAIPYNITIRKQDHRNIATLVFLCRGDDDALFTLSRNYIIPSEEHIEFIKSIPFYNNDDERFTSQKMCDVIMVRYMNNYVLDMDFTIKNDQLDSNNPIFTITGIGSRNRDKRTFTMTSEIFSVLNFVDSYVFSCDTNNHDLELSAAIGFSEVDKETPLYFVEDVSIISMARAQPTIPVKKSIKNLFKKKKKIEDNTAIGMALKVNRVKDGGSDIQYLMIPFDIGVSFEEEKFKGNTITKIQELFYGDSDQYVSTLMIPVSNIKFVSDDEEAKTTTKNYMIIRGKTTDKSTMLFFFDMALKEQLIELIKSY